MTNIHLGISGEFSGKIGYKLDNKKEFEVYRNFIKKNPQIFDKNANDISKEFTIDKTLGNRFFYEQTKVDEELFNMSMVIHQQEVRLDDKSQNTLIQKASNIMLTGEDNTSYKKIVSNLNKRQTEEIGTLKSPTRPLYLAKSKVEELLLKKTELEKLNPIKNEIEEEIKKIKSGIKQEEDAFVISQELEEIKRIKTLEEEKINIQVKAKVELEKNKDRLKKELDETREDISETSNSSKLYFIPILFLIISIILFILINQIAGIFAILFTIFSFIIVLLKNIKEKKEYENKYNEIRKQKRAIESKREIIEGEITSKEKLIKEAKETLELNLRIRKKQIHAKYPNLTNLDLENIQDTVNIFEQQNYINNLKLDLGKKEIELTQIIQKLDEAVEIEEKLNINKEVLNELIEYDEIINIAKEALEDAYLEMRDSITPKFTENLSNSIRNITVGKYKTVKINEESGLSLETANRKLYCS